MEAAGKAFLAHRMTLLPCFPQAGFGAFNFGKASSNKVFLPILSFDCRGLQSTRGSARRWPDPELLSKGPAPVAG